MYYARKTQSGARVVGISVAVVLNLILGYALATGLGAQIVNKLTQTEVVIIEEQKKDEEPPPPPPPVDVELPPPPPQVVLPEFTFDAPPPPNAIQQVQQVERPAPRPEVRPAPAPVPQTRVNPTRRKNGTLPEYPPASERAKEEGISTVTLCVDATGKVTDAKLVNSSGFPRLDDATVKWALRERFNPGTVGGVKTAMCDYRMDYQWQMPKR